jgi:hypothetical protein
VTLRVYPRFVVVVAEHERSSGELKAQGSANEGTSCNYIAPDLTDLYERSSAVSLLQAYYTTADT